MALPTYLELVNDILVRMREPEVTTVNENVLSKLVGRLVNDAKRQVEDAYNWNALTATLMITTVADTYGYVLTGVGGRFKVMDARNMNTKGEIKPVPTKLMSEYLFNNMTPGSPMYYNFNGVHTTGDTKVDFYPVPEPGLDLYFNLYVPQEELKADSDTMLTPKEPVVLGAFARAVVERGEDGGLPSSEAYALYKASLSDYIAIESSRYIEEETWEAV
jgi:hypothetical protein